jgi:hypothetical protein
MHSGYVHVNRQTIFESDVPIARPMTAACEFNARQIRDAGIVTFFGSLFLTLYAAAFMPIRIILSFSHVVI